MMIRINYWIGKSKEVLMSKSSKKPRQKRNSREYEEGEKVQKKEKDWSFEDIARSKPHR